MSLKNYKPKQLTVVNTDGAASSATSGYGKSRSAASGGTISSGMTETEIQSLVSKLVDNATKDYKDEIIKSISDQFLSRINNDTASGLITFNEGLKSDGDVRSKEFVTGIVGGKGWKTDKDGNFEVESLTARSYIGAPEFRFNYIDAVAGEMWQTNGYGVIASVDTESRTATLRLEDGVYGTLAQNDICRGMFCNFGEGQQVEGTDECGFPTLYGFSTAYFTPTEIIQNAAGVMVFRYAIKSGTTMHPCVNMKFASYGNFTDSTRQRTTYFCKDYLRMLRNVSTWEINTKKSVCVQLGKLDGLQYGSQDLTGEGMFCQDGYFVNSWVQLRPEQIAELQGDSAYSVNLSGEEGIVTIDEEGNIVGGTTAMYNVTAGDENVTTGVYNVTALGYRLQTRIQAFKGTEELEYSDSMEGEGYFVVGMHCVGCSATLVSGVVTVISVTSTETCYIELSINCEGNAFFSKTYQVSAVYNGKSPILADIDNEMAAVACDSDGKVLFGLPVSTVVSVWAGTTQLSIDSLTLTTPDGVTATCDKTTGKIEVTAITDDAEQTLPIDIAVKATWGGIQYEKKLAFTVTKQVCGESAMLYQLLPSANAIKIDDEGTYSDISINCKISQMDGAAMSVLTSIPEGLTITVSDNGGVEKAYTYGSEHSVKGVDGTVKFFLYNKENVLLDQETIPILKDGANLITADFDNEMDAVACDEEGNVLDGFLPVSTIFSMYAGNSKLNLYSLSSSGASGASVTVDKSTGKVSVTAITKDAAATLRIPITGTARYPETEDGTLYSRTLYFVVNKQICGENAKIYQLLPSLSAIKKDKDGNYTSSYLSCKLRYTNGAVSSDTTTLPSGYTMKYALDGGTAASYTINSTIKTAGITQQVAFYLYNGSTLLDVENVPVIIDGTDGQVNFTSYVFQRSNTEPTKPTGGSYTSPVPSGWSDGIPDGEAMVWMSKRVFTNDGLSPQDEEWSDPKQMTDTADFDVDYSSLASPSAPSGHPNTTSGWSNSTKDAIWMATSNCRNGVWSDWVVTKIVGEDAEIYQLVLSTKAVKITSTGAYTVDKVTCGVKHTSGLTTTTLSSLPSGFTLKVSRDGGSESTYTLGSSLAVSPSTNKITFSLYEGSILRVSDEVSIVSDGGSGVVADLSNEMDGVACTAAGKPTGTVSLSTIFSIYSGTTQQTLTSLTVGSVTGVTASANASTGVVSVTDITSSAPTVIQLPITGKAIVDGTEISRTLTFTINKVMPGFDGDDAVVYQLLPSVACVRVDTDKTWSTKTVSCGLVKTSGESGGSVTSLPSGYYMYYTLDGGSETSYTINSNVTVSSASNNITFILKYGYGTSKTVMDRETVPIVFDGAKGNTGDAGEAAVMYELSPNLMPIRQTMTGSLSPSSYTVQCYKTTGSTRATTGVTSWKVECSTDGSTWNTYSSGNYTKDTTNGKLTLTISTSYTHYRITATVNGQSVIGYAVVTTDGSTGVGISSVDEYYAISASGTTAPSSGWSKTAPTPTTSNPYLWNYEVVNYSDGTSETKDKHLVGYLGADGSAGKGISSVTEYYAVSSSSSTAPTSWYTTLQTTTSSNPYLWNYTKITYTDNTTYSSTAQVIGNYAEKGDTGSMPRYRGTWSSSETYEYNSDYCDIVVYEGAAYKRINFGVSCSGSTKKPTNTTYWESASSYSFVAMDTALIDGANIAGFMFKDNKMVSQEGDESVVLDGVNGTITAKGSFTSGDADGQRIVMDGDDKSVKIYDENDNLVNELTGGEVVEDLIPDGVTASGQKFSQKWTMKSASSGQTKEDSLSQSAHLKVRGSGTLTLSVTGIEISINRTTSTLTTYPSVTCYGRLINATTNSVVSLLCYKQITQTSSATYNSETISDFTKQITIGAGEYYVRFDFILNRGSDTSVTFNFAAQLSDLAYTEDFFASIHAKNGFVVSQNSDNYLSAAITSKLMELCLVGSGNGLKIGANGIQVRSNSSTEWKNMPMLLYKCRVICSKSSSTISYSVTVDYTYTGSSTISASRSDEGKVVVTLPSSPSISISDMIHAIAYTGSGNDGTANGAGHVTIRSISSNVITFYLADDATLNDFSFMFDVWKL